MAWQNCMNMPLPLVATLQHFSTGCMHTTNQGQHNFFGSLTTHRPNPPSPHRPFINPLPVFPPWGRKQVGGVTACGCWGRCWSSVVPPAADSPRSLSTQCWGEQPHPGVWVAAPGSGKDHHWWKIIRYAWNVKDYVALSNWGMEGEKIK